MARYTVVQILDKCLKCRGCMVACQRVNKLDSDGVAEKVQYDDYVVVKSQSKRSTPDMGPYVRYNCWHCPTAPCGASCPWGALYERKDSNGDILGVDVDRSYCHYGLSGTYLNRKTGALKTAKCRSQCRKNCMRGGYPKFGANDMVSSSTYVYKCTLCATKIASGDLTEPACVTACPNNALRYGKISGSTVVDTTRGTLTLSDYTYRATVGGFYWVSSHAFGPPTSDPYVEDHLTPMVSRFLLSPAGVSFLMPAAVVGGLYGLIKRRMTLQNV